MAMVVLEEVGATVQARRLVGSIPYLIVGSFPSLIGQYVYLQGSLIQN